MGPSPLRWPVSLGWRTRAFGCCGGVTHGTRLSTECCRVRGQALCRFLRFSIINTAPCDLQRGSPGTYGVSSPMEVTCQQQYMRNPNPGLLPNHSSLLQQHGSLGLVMVRMVGQNGEGVDRGGQSSLSSQSHFGLALRTVPSLRFWTCRFNLLSVLSTWRDRSMWIC